MFKVEYFHADTGETHFEFRSTKKAATELLDKWIDNSPENVKKVSAWKVTFKNGDYARIADLVPLSALMLDDSFRARVNGPDSIFEDQS